jgi:hypothetical protein
MRQLLILTSAVAGAMLISACGAAKFGSDGTTVNESVTATAVPDPGGDPALPAPPVTKADTTCHNGKKALICHFPPGNPDNMHTLCVGWPAVPAHVAEHQDTLGACAGQDPNQAVEE